MIIFLSRVPAISGGAVSDYDWTAWTHEGLPGTFASDLRLAIGALLAQDLLPGARMHKSHPDILELFPLDGLFQPSSLRALTQYVLEKSESLDLTFRVKEGREFRELLPDDFG